MIESSSIDKKLAVVFDELAEDLSVVSSGILFIHIRDNRIISFGVRQPTECESGNPIHSTQEDRIGLSCDHQSSFRNMAIRVFKKKRVWADGEMLFIFQLQARTLRAFARYKALT